MKRPTWIKDLLFLAVALAGAGLLSIGFLTTQRLPEPTGFATNGIRHEEVRLVAHRVDQAFASSWNLAGVDPVGPADSLTVARRLGLGLAGTIPSLEEIRRMEQIPEAQRITWWVSHLLQDERTANFVAERLARAMVGVEEGPFLVYRRRRFTSWLAEQFVNNRPYNDLIYEILTNEGLWTDTPSVNFYTRTITEDNDKRPDPILLAGRTSRVFLGMRIDCLQCHDDFMGSINLGDQDSPTGGTQLDFHSLAAFFAETENSLLGIRDHADPAGYQYQLLHESEPTRIAPAVPFLKNLDQRSGSLRQRLASWITNPDNRPFARATVNRIWAIMAGRGLIQPVDDIPLDGPFPPAMEVLVDDLIASQFDLHRLIRVIASTRAYQLASYGDVEITADHERVWASFPMVRLRPDQASGAIAQATQLSTIDATSHIITRLTKFGQQNDFVRRFGDPGENEFEDRGETVTQRLLMLNGNMISERIKNGLNSCVHIPGLAPTDVAAVEVAYLSTLSRFPSPIEIETHVAGLKAKTGDDRGQEMVDIYWSLLNSAEFCWNH